MSVLIRSLRNSEARWWAETAVLEVLARTSKTRRPHLLMSSDQSTAVAHCYSRNTSSSRHFRKIQAEHSWSLLNQQDAAPIPMHRLHQPVPRAGQ